MQASKLHSIPYNLTNVAMAYMNPLHVGSDRRVDAIEWILIATIFLGIPMHILEYALGIGT